MVWKIELRIDAEWVETIYVRDHTYVSDHIDTIVNQYRDSRAQAIGIHIHRLSVAPMQAMDDQEERMGLG